MKRILFLLAMAAAVWQFHFPTDLSAVTTLFQTSRKRVPAPVPQLPRLLDPLALVPQDALLLLDTANISAAGQAFSTSAFGRTLRSANGIAMLRQFGAPSMLVKLLRGQDTDVQFLFKALHLEDIFNRRTVLALMPPDELKQLSSRSLENFLADNLLLTIPGEPDTTAALLARLQEQQQGATALYQGVRILTSTLQQGRNVHAAAVRGHLLVSLRLSVLQKSIDIVTKKKKSLLGKADYAAMKQQAHGKDDFFFYADLVGLKSLTAQDAPASQLGTQSVSLFHYRQARTEHVTAIVRFSPAELPPVQKRFYTAAPQGSRSLGTMPADLLLYFWTNWLEPDFLQQTFLADQENKTVAKVEAWFKKQSGLNLSAILSLLGQEFSFNIAGIKTESFFPVPSLCFVLSLRQQNKAQALLNRLLAGLPIKRKKTAGTTVVSLQAAKGMMQPSYAFVNGLLIMADSREQLVDILSEKKKKMIAESDFQAVDTGLLQPSNLLLFARITELVNGLQELAAWIGTMIAVQDAAAGAKSKVLIDEVIAPLLNSLSGFATVSVRSYVRPGELVVKTAALRAEQSSATREK